MTDSPTTKHAAQREHDADEQGATCLCQHCCERNRDFYPNHNIGDICDDCLIAMFRERLIKFCGIVGNKTVMIDTRSSTTGTLLYFLVSWTLGSSDFEAMVVFEDVASMEAE